VTIATSAVRAGAQRTDDAEGGIASSLRAATAGEHRSAEDRSFIVQLMGGELSLVAYTRYLAQFAWVYEQLESRPRQSGDPALFDPALARSASIENDLSALGVLDWRAQHPMLPATAAYVAHLASIPADDTVRWIAHHYTRYLGDLSGGQAIARLVARHYGASADQLSFFEFADIDNLVAYKRAYREGLDALLLTADEHDLLVAEVRRAYRLNSAVFDDLA
jgi:heme oxygenase (biliverdin-producing, ferredoxin)